MAEDINKEGNEEQDKSIFNRYLLLTAVLLLAACWIVVKMCITMFVEKDQWTTMAKELVRPTTTILPSRGNIYSNNMKLMATSVPRYYTYIDFKSDALQVDSFLYSKRNGVDSLSICLSRKFKDRTPAGYKAYLLRGLKSQSRQYPLVRHKISYSDFKELGQYPHFRLGRNRSGFYTKEQVQRERPFNTLAARTIGDIFGEIDSTGVTRGRNGLELQYDSLLRGKPGLKVKRRIGGRWTNVTLLEPEEGMDIRSTIDIDIQDITEKALRDMLKKIDAASGTAVVMEVATGEVKAITNLGRISEGKYNETMNHAVADETEPGSTFKVASIMVALEDGVCQPQDSVDTGNGIYMYKGQRMTDHNKNKGGYQVISVEKAIWNSSNIGVGKNDLERI